MKKILFTVALLLTINAFASANPGSQFCNGCGNRNGWGLFVKSPVPAFQAAPWYSYWPYNSHFQTPAPLTGAYYAPSPGGQLSNPYFPAAYPAPAGQPIPGR